MNLSFEYDSIYNYKLALVSSYKCVVWYGTLPTIPFAQFLYIEETVFEIVGKLHVPNYNCS